MEKKEVPSNQISQGEKKAVNEANKKNIERSISSIDSNSQKVHIPKQPDVDIKDIAKGYEKKLDKVQEKAHKPQQKEPEQKSTLLQRAKQMVKAPIEKLKEIHKEVTASMPAKQSTLQRKAQQTKVSTPPQKQQVKSPPSKGRTK